MYHKYSVFLKQNNKFFNFSPGTSTQTECIKDDDESESDLTLSEGASTVSRISEVEKVENISQTKISDIFLSKNVRSKKSEKITQLIANMIAIDMLPISYVEGEGFKSLCKHLAPFYKIPSRGTIMNRLNSLYEIEKTRLLEKLSGLQFCSLTTDCWTSRNNVVHHGYLSYNFK